MKNAGVSDDLVWTSTDEQVMALREGASPHLCKAVDDQWKYVCRLRTGELIVFESATVLGAGWIRLQSCESEQVSEFWTSRGLDVRIADIVWVGDGMT